jgi:signal transduction histidine kinase
MEAIDQDIAHAGKRLNRHMAADRRFLESLAAQIASGLLDEEIFERRVTRYMQRHPELVDIAWVDGRHVVGPTVSDAATNQPADQFARREPRKVSTEAWRTGSAVYTHALAGAEGEIALELHVPIPRGDEHAGVIVGVYSLENLLDRVLPRGLLERYTVSFVCPTIGVLASVTKSFRVGHAITRQTAVDGTKYRLELAKYESERPLHIVMLWIIAASFAIGMAWSMSLLARDISKRHRLHREHESLIAELGQKNAELERYAYTISHDLKAPLFAIQGFTELLRQDVKAGAHEAVDEDMTEIENATETMTTLLNSLLDLSRYGMVANSSEELHLGDLVDEVLGVSSKQTHISLALPSDLPAIVGDRSRLLIVLQNLVDNALKFGKDSQTNEVTIGAEARDGVALCYVRDTGVGIPPDYRERVFNLFERLDADKPGTGVGLAIVKRIVEAHDGRIWIESEGRGRGTTVFFTVPVATPKDSNGESRP